MICPNCHEPCQELTATDGKGFVYDYWQCIYDDCQTTFQHVNGVTTMIEKPEARHVLGNAK